MKLVPKIATIDLVETISLPLHVMKAMEQESHTQITLAPVPENLGSHIITDQQWLQENIMCLLSNAVKYSSRGEVHMSLNLVTVDDVENRHVSTRPMLNKSSIHVEKESPVASGQSEKTHMFWPCQANNVKATNHNTTERSSSVASLAVNSISSVHVNFARVITDAAPVASSRQSNNAKFLRVEVEDNGIGLSEDAMGTLFR